MQSFAECCCSFPVVPCLECLVTTCTHLVIRLDLDMQRKTSTRWSHKVWGSLSNGSQQLQHIGPDKVGRYLDCNSLTLQSNGDFCSKVSMHDAANYNVAFQGLLTLLKATRAA